MWGTTMIYTHVLHKRGRGILSPLDALSPRALAAQRFAQDLRAAPQSTKARCQADVMERSGLAAGLGAFRRSR